MNRPTLTKLMLSLFCVFALTSCAEKYFEDQTYELYTRNFIKEFGLIDPEHDWNMATQAVIRLNLGEKEHASVKVYCKQGYSYYLIADLNNVKGVLNVPVDVPKDTKDILVKTDGRQFYGTIDRTIDCSNASRGVPDYTYSTTTDDGVTGSVVPTYTVEPNAAAGTYGITVTHTTTGKLNYDSEAGTGCYQYLNTQQIAPIVSPEVWSDYWSLNTGQWTVNANKNATDHSGIGLLPERAIFDTPTKTLEDEITQRKAENHELVVDYTLSAGDDGRVTFFPYYYGTNLAHELGVYLIDDNGEPRKSNGKWVKFPVFKDRDHGDLQVKPHYDTNITEFDVRDWPSDFGVNQTFNILDHLYLKLNNYNGFESKKDANGWVKYSDYQSKLYQTHSRFAFHLQMNGDDTQYYAECSKSGIFTATSVMPNENPRQICIAIANNLSKEGSVVTGIKQNLDFITSSNPQATNIKFDYNATMPSGVVLTKKSDTSAKIKIPVGCKCILPIRCQSTESKTLADIIDNIYFEQYHTSYFELAKDGNGHITIEGKDVKSDWAHIKYGKNDLVLEFEVYNNSTTHTYTESFEFTALNSTGTPPITFDNWHTTYFNSTNEVETPILSETESVTVAHWNNHAEIEASKFSTATAGQKMRLYFSLDNDYEIDYDEQGNETYGQYNQIKFVYDNGSWAEFASGVLDPINLTYSNSNPQTYDITLTSDMLDILKNYKTIIFGHHFTLTKVTLVSTGDTYSYQWNADGKSQAATDLETYYNTHTPGSQTCGDCSASVDFSGATASVTISDDAGYDRIKYTVTWTKRVTSSAPMRNGMPISRDGSSDVPTSVPDIINPAHSSNSSVDWIDVNSTWNKFTPMGEEVASYPPNQPMLARTRGYDITIKNPDGTPYTGAFGMYIKTIGEYRPSSDDYDNGTKTSYLLKYSTPYELYSERKYNTYENSSEVSNQIAAVTFKHPVTQRTFFAFEDMDLNKKGDGTSSDQDVNDVVFLISGYASIKEKDGDEITEEFFDEGFPWIWAVEDLGSIDDFDFNDLVMRVTSITTTKKTTQGSGDNTTVTYNVTKKVTFEPLAAGGTLPLYIHLKVGNNDYILQPGEFDITTGSVMSAVTDKTGSSLVAATDSELHKWFGNSGYSSGTMINTGAGASTKTIKNCVLYVDAPTTTDGSTYTGGFTMNIFSSSGKIVDNSKVTSDVRFYITVNQPNVAESQGGIYDSQLSNAAQAEGWTISNTNLGAAPQSFVIKGNSWRWPLERHHILQAYPNFKEWVKNSDNTDWISTNVQNEHIYK